MKNRIKINTGWITGFLFLLIMLISGQKACAAVTEGVPGETYHGDYVVIVNTATEKIQGSTASGNVAVSGTVSYKEGSQRSFYTYSGYKMFTCIGISEHSYIWMENSLKASYDSAGYTEAIAADMAQTYEQGAWDVLNRLSSGQMVYRDGSGKLSIVLEQISSASGVYMGKQNEPDITAIHINAPQAENYRAGKMRTNDGLLVHEGQHALFEQFTEYNPYGKYMGITEGLSVAAMEYAWGNSDGSSWLDKVAGNQAVKNGSALLYRSYRDQSAQDYGLPYLFIRYLINRKSGTYDPLAFFHAAYSVKASGDAGSYLAEVMGEDFGDLITDFYTAVAANEAAGVYGFYGDAAVQSALRSYPLCEGNDVDSVHLEPAAGIIMPLKAEETFTVPVSQGSTLRYRIVGKENTALAPLAGSGTAADPYQITSVRDWNQIANHPGAYYELQKDLSMEGNTATMISTFSGCLDGNGHTVCGVTQPFCTVNKGKIQNLKLTAEEKGAGRNDYGFFAKQNEGQISNCMLSGTIYLMLSGDSDYVGTAFGGIAGRNEVAGTVKNCSVTADIVLSAPACTSRNGGITGCNSGIIQSCYFRGTLQVEQKNGENQKVYTGGIAGETNRDYGMGGSLKKCLNAGRITSSGGMRYTGQICGFAAANVSPVNTYINSCYGKSSSTLPLLGWYGGASQTQPELTESRNLTDEEWTDRNSFKGLDFDTDWKLGPDGPELTGEADITSIEVKNAPSACLAGERLFWWGSLLINGKGTVQITDDMVSSFDNLTLGTQTVRVRYMGKTVSYTIQVEKPGNITTLTTSGTLKKSSYAEGEVFDPAGLMLVAQINGKYHYIQEGFTWNKMPLKQTDTSVALSYYGSSIQIPIQVTAKTPSRLELNREQSRSYAAGAVLDLSDVKVRISYNNGENTDWLTPSDFDRYGIRLAKAAAGSNTYMDISRSQILNTSDSGSTYCFYVGSVLPGKTGTVCCKLGTMTVRAPLQIEGQDIYFTAGKECYGYLNLSGGSSSYQTTVKSEKLPQGVTCTFLPNEYSGTFGYQGSTSQKGEFTSVYLVTDRDTKEQKEVRITLHVQASNEVQMISFELKAAQNTDLKQDVKGKISEKEIILELPEGTNVTALMPSIEYGAGAGADCNYWNGSRRNFTSPVTYILTAPDGVTQRTYLVRVVFRKTSGQQPSTTPSTEPETKPSEEPSAEPGAKPSEQPVTEPETKPSEHPSTNPAGGQADSKPSATLPAKTETKATEQQTSTEKQTEKKPAKKVTVTLNVTTLPIQVKKSTTVLKIKKKASSDSVKKWTTSNKKIVTVNAKTGKLTAKKTGKATITVYMRSGAKAKCVVKVQKGKVKTQKLTVTKTAVALKKNARYRIAWGRQPLTSTEKVTFQTSNKKIAVVSSKGTITAKKKGTAYITIQSGAKKRKVKVTVK